MRRFIVRFFAVVGFLFLLAVGGIVGAFVWLSPKAPSLGTADILVLDLNHGYSEAPSATAITSILNEEQPSLRDLLDGIERAAGDPRIKGIVAHLGAEEYGSGKTQEIRDAIMAFRSKGKFAIAHAESFGEGGSGTRSYYLATAFDRILLQPFGVVGLTGFRAEVPFAKDLLDKLGIEAKFEHRSEYKTAMNSLTERGMTPAHREETDSILKSIFGQTVRDIAAARQIDEAEVRKLVDGGPHLYRDAEKLKLIDGIGYWEDALEAARSRAANAKTVTLRRYLEAAGHPNTKGPTVALIHAVGMIQRGDSGGSPLSGSTFVGSDSLVRALHKASEDKEVSAILLRIDSPGGSATASETIWNEVVRVRNSGKPVIVSMSDVAGSGGYYIAAGATKIVAQPGTLTGSIGVVAGKIMTGQLWEKLGVRWEASEAGGNASMYSSIQDYTPQGKQRFEASLDEVYEGFKSRVAMGRKLSPEKVEEIARGRVWTGEDAKARGLVDELGGYAVALRLAKEAMGVTADQEVTLKAYPPPKDTREILLSRLLGRDEEETEATASTAAKALAPLRSVFQRIEVLTAPQGALLMQPPELRPDP